jgi:riboflavin kinase/FMN adenylyltransferase
LSIGNFDGVHRGHQALLAEAVRQAHALHVHAVAVTFDPHPWQVLRPSSFQPLLTTIEERAELLQHYGAEHVLVLQTTPELLSLEAGAFFEQIIRECLQARALVEGYNFAFGHNRGGTIEVLQRLCQEAGLPLTLLPPQEVHGQTVSSSRVRNDILAGAMAKVRLLLDRPYRLRGTVGAGQRRGQALGIPTANLVEIATLVPGDGVYAVRAVCQGHTWPAAANVGPNPTFGEHARKVEVHLIGFQGNLYGENLTIDFLEKIRDTRPFAGAAELVAQIHADIATARRICSDPLAG